MLLLWRNAFPRSVKELESEKATGDAFTWQVCLEGRSGALATIQSFLMHCSELATEDVVRRVLPSLECALSMTTQLVCSDTVRYFTRNCLIVLLSVLLVH